MTFWWSTTQFLLSMTFTGNFIYFAMKHQQRDADMGFAAKCQAKAGLNHPIKTTDDTDLSAVVDVSEQFFVIFVVGLALNILTAVWSIAACFLSQR